RSERFAVRLLFEARPPIGEPEREEGHEIEERHPEGAVPPSLAQVHALVPKEDLAVRVVERVPRLGDVEGVADDRVVAGEKLALASEREREKRPVDRAAELARALVADAKAREFAAELLEQLFAGHACASRSPLRRPRCSPPSTSPSASTRPFTSSKAESSRRPSSCARTSSSGPVPVPTS